MVTPLRVPVVWSEDCLRHEPLAEIWLGVRTAGTEVPAQDCEQSDTPPVATPRLARAARSRTQTDSMSASRGVIESVGAGPGRVGT